MLDELVLYATYYETMNKFADNIKKYKDQDPTVVALKFANNFHKSVENEASEASIKQVKSLLYKNIVASFQHGGGFRDTVDNNAAEVEPLDQEEIKELASDLTDSILEDLGF